MSKTKLAAKNSSQSPHLVLANAISGMEKGMTTFNKSVEAFTALREAIIQNLDNEIKTTTRAFDDMKLKFEADKKSRQIDMDQAFKASATLKALEVLKSNNQTAISMDELADLKKQLVDLQTKYTEDLKAQEAKLSAKSKRDKAAALHIQELQHKATVAELTAQNNHLQSTITESREQNTRQRTEIADMRVLVKDIAEASKSAQIVQHVGGK